MSRGERLSVLGLYHHNNRLFNSMHFPDGFSQDEKDTVIANILAECAELECLYPNYETMHFMIGAWSALEMPVWNRIYTASKLEYNPIENYNRTENETITNDLSETHSGTDSTAHTGKDTSSSSASGSETNSGTDSTTNSVTAYDSSNLYTHDKTDLLHGHAVSTTGSQSGSLTYGKMEALTHGEVISHDDTITKESHISGNIGVTTSQQMLEQEINIAAALNVGKLITESFRERFCLLVY